jgi:hypothetical protein
LPHRIGLRAETRRKTAKNENRRATKAANRAGLYTRMLDMTRGNADFPPVARVEPRIRSGWTSTPSWFSDPRQ